MLAPFIDKTTYRSYTKIWTIIGLNGAETALVTLLGVCLAMPAPSRGSLSQRTWTFSQQLDEREALTGCQARVLTFQLILQVESLWLQAHLDL